MRGPILILIALASGLLYANPVAAFDPNPPVQEYPDEPCTPDSVFDTSCDGGGGNTLDRCTENCKVCETRNGRFGCYSTPYAGSCSCWTDWADNDGTPLLVCNERGSCSVWV